jgi:Copper binding proteins, plastocyanin/azurin family
MVTVVSTALLAGVIVFGSQVVGSDSPSTADTSGQSSGQSGQLPPDPSGRRGKISRPSFAAEVDADPSGAFAWRQTRIDDIPAGDVLLAIRNDSSVPHNIAIEDSKGKLVASPSTTVAAATASVSARLVPGTYRYFCAVPGHRAAGMEGTLNVVAIGR